MPMTRYIAMDATDASGLLEIAEHLRQQLSEEEIVQLIAILGGDAEAVDERPALAGDRRRSRLRYAQDEFDARFPSARRIALDDNFGVQPSRKPSSARVRNWQQEEDDFNERFPSAARIGVL